jgi:REP-associated tyrosine transposase
VINQILSTLSSLRRDTLPRVEGSVYRERPYRRPIRLRDRDYRRAGRYFVTIVTHQRAELFGTIVDGIMHLSAEGECAQEVWTRLPRHYAHVVLDAFVVMPNHVHGIVILKRDDGDEARRAPLSEVVRGFKTFSARRVNGIRGVIGTAVWQRSYFERVIRDERELHNVRQYIAENPARWDDDAENPCRLHDEHAPTV